MSTIHKYEGPGAANTEALTNNQTSTPILCFEPDSGNKSVQRAQVLAALQVGPVDTLGFRAMGIASPAPRVLELRREGWQVDTLRRGRFALYSLARSVLLGAGSLAVYVAGTYSAPPGIDKPVNGTPRP